MALETRQTNRMKKEEWYTCERCDQQYPRSAVVVHNGMVVCQGRGTFNCKDQPGRDAYYKNPLPVEQPLRPLPTIVEDI